jgi:C4-dicarboxylate transporter DctQ subunit
MYSIGITMEDIYLPQVFIELFDEDTLWDIFRIDAEEPLMPLWISQSILFIGFILLFYRFFQLLLQVISGKANGFKFADEAEESMHLIQTDEQADTNSEKNAAPHNAQSNDDQTEEKR